MGRPNVPAGLWWWPAGLGTARDGDVRVELWPFGGRFVCRAGNLDRSSGGRCRGSGVLLARKGRFAVSQADGRCSFRTGITCRAWKLDIDNVEIVPDHGSLRVYILRGSNRA